mgnify:CR=1 FL=1
MTEQLMKSVHYRGTIRGQTSDEKRINIRKWYDQLSNGKRSVLEKNNVIIR